jgi:hypothetical protein
MRTIWRILIRTVFWSFERGTWPYDIAVVLIVVFVLLSPRSWFHDRPPDAPRASALLPLRDPGSSSTVETYRVDARALNASTRGAESALERELQQWVRRNGKGLQQDHFHIVRIEPVRGKDGAVDYYDVSIRP